MEQCSLRRAGRSQPLRMARVLFLYERVKGSKAQRSLSCPNTDTFAG